MADSTPEKEPASNVSEVETADKDILSEMLTENIEKEFLAKEEPEEPHEDGTTSEENEVQKEDNAQDEAPPPENVEASEGDADQEAVEEKKETKEVSPLEAPQHWSARDKERFKNMTREAQDYVLERDKSMTADYTRKTQEVAQIRQAMEPLAQVLAPVRNVLRQSGISEAEYVARLMRADQMLQQNPHGAIQELARNAGIDLEALEQTAEQIPQADPRVNALQQQVQQLQGYLENNEERAAQERHAGLHNQIEMFANETDKDGNLKHPHFGNLRKTMGNLIQAGVSVDLNDAYNKALRLDETMYQQSLEAERTKVKSAEDSRRKEAVAKAKKVPTRRAANPPSGSVQATTLDDHIAVSLDNAGM
jgi:hypothetical protein